MAPENNQPGFTVTLRDVYDLLADTNEKVDSRLGELDKHFTEHALHDEQRFARLNTKVYGVLVSLLAGFGGVLALFSHAKGF